MNFITHDTAYSLYPRATFLENTSLIFDDVSRYTVPCDNDELAILKYMNRGWTFAYIPVQSELSSLQSERSFARRSFEDAHTWSIKIVPIIYEKREALYNCPMEKMWWLTEVSKSKYFSKSYTLSHIR